jgi:uncharacterized protein HemX
MEMTNEDIIEQQKKEIEKLQYLVKGLEEALSWKVDQYEFVLNLCYKHKIIDMKKLKCR